jgi:hypothetical protein
MNEAESKMDITGIDKTAYTENLVDITSFNKDETQGHVFSNIGKENSQINANLS